MCLWGEHLQTAMVRAIDGVVFARGQLVRVYNVQARESRLREVLSISDDGTPGPSFHQLLCIQMVCATYT